MLDEFREQASQFNDEQPEVETSAPTVHRTRFLGMTPVQTFIIAILLLLITCLLSIFCLLATGRVVPPIMY